MPNKLDRISRQKLREQLIADYIKRKEEEKESQQRKEKENGKH